MGKPRILWGPGLENTLQFAERLDMPLSGHPLRSPSEQARAGRNTEDARSAGYDYALAGEGRWFGDDAWHGPNGADAFIAWARGKNTFSYVPDDAFPDFTVPGCYLVEPTTGGLGGGLEHNEQRRLPLVLRNPLYDFSLARRGLFMEYAPGALPLPPLYTFTGAGARHQAITELTLKQAASGVLRDRDYWNGVRTTRLEGAITNLIADPEKLDLWSTPSDATVTSNVVPAPTRSQTGDKVVEGSGVTIAHMVGQTVTLTVQAGNRISGICHVRSSERTRGAFYVSDGNNGANRVGVEFNLSAQTAVSFLGGDGVSLYVYIRALRENWYEVGFSGTMTITTASSRAWVRLHDGTSFTYTGNGTSGLFAWGAAVVELNNHVGSYPAGGVSRVAELLTMPWPWKPQGSWFYVKFIELGGAFKAGGSATGRLMMMGIGNARMTFSCHGDKRWNFEHWNDLNVGVSASMSVDVAFGNTIELLGRLKETGATELRWSINGGAEGSHDPNTANTFAPAWATGGMGINARTDGTSHAHCGLVLARAGRNVNAITTIALARSV